MVGYRRRTNGSLRLDAVRQWDYERINEVVLVDMNVDGKARKPLVALRPQRLSPLFDRTDGTLLRANSTSR